jgi:pimeloyl-ACP methyl ester carboxylesterase
MEFYTVPGEGWRIATGRTAGAGPLLVYVHGLGCAGSRDWPPVAGAPALAGRASLWVDLLGFGLSDKPPQFSYDLAEQAGILAAFIQAAVNQPFALVGHSMGGTLSVLLAELLAVAGRPPVAVVLAEPVLDPAIATNSARVAAKPEARFVAAWERWAGAHPSPFYREDMRMATGYAYHRSAVSLLRHSRGLMAQFAGLAVPVKGFILGGQSDRPMREQAEQTAALGVALAVVPGSGHGFSEDDPAGFAEAIAALT